jgi:hypothetical protein
MQIRTWYVLPLVVLSLLLAIWSGWIRIGWSLPGNAGTAHHGALMIGSFLSTVIFLERAVTFKSKLVLLLPFVNGLSAVFFIAGLPLVAQSLLLAGSLGFCIMCLYFIYRYHELYYYLFFAAAFCLAIANWLLIRTQFFPQAVPWFMGFFLFTIVAERLELSRFLVLTKKQNYLLLFCLAVTFIGLLIPFHYNGNVVFATGLILTACWLFRYDMAMKSIRKAGQHRYSAILLITGYVWLIITAAFLYAGNVNAFWYDATLHSFFIGFVISMIFSHAPIILPAVLKLPVKPYRPGLYVLFAIMQLSLIARVIADGFLLVAVRKWSGMLNGITLLLFFILIALLVKVELHKRRRVAKAV